MNFEQEYVLSAFQENFRKFRDQNIVIYGLGANTKFLLDAMKDEYHFIGLMDGVRTGETVFGLPVLSMEEALGKGVDVILILARAANVAIIYPRIAAACERHGIPVYDINGIEQHRNKMEDYTCPEFYATHTCEALLTEIRKADVVSFDVFDTLLMRQCLEPTDVFSIVEQTAKRRGLIPSDFSFAKQRILAERALYPGAPTLLDVYERLGSDTGLDGDTLGELRTLELTEEERQLVPRTAVVEVLREAQAMGKTVCATSDMYLSGHQISRLLLSNGITEIDHVFVSSDESVSKTEGLFDRVQAAYPGKRILHLGDNATADVQGAEAAGLAAWLIPSARQMLSESTFAHLTEYNSDLPERIYLGRFLAQELNDPFLFAQTKGRLRLTDAYTLGHDFVGPMVAGFVTWLIERCTEDGIEMLILGARDGWVVRQILDEVSRFQKLPFQYRYIYVSRAVCTSAGVENEDDVLYATKHYAWDGGLEGFLEHRFQLPAEEIQPPREGESKESYARRHMPAILRSSAEKRKRYRAYLQSEGIARGMRIGIFDFVAAGTCQYWMEKILGQPMQGYYFLRVFDPYKAKLAIQTYYRAQSVGYQTGGAHLLGNYFFMENIISSPEPTAESVGEDGLHFQQDDRESKAIRDLLAIQRGICDAARELAGIPERRELADEILHLVHHETCDVQLAYLQQNDLIDEFTHRTFPFATMI